MANASSVLKLIKDKEVKFVDLRFTDPRGKWQHVTYDLSLVDEEFLTDGTMFDGSSIAGWKAINESDMTLLPDCETLWPLPALHRKSRREIYGVLRCWRHRIFWTRGRVLLL